MAYKYEKTAKLLDELMGANRNQDKKVEIIEVGTAAALQKPHAPHSLRCWRIRRTSQTRGCANSS